MRTRVIFVSLVLALLGAIVLSFTSDFHSAWLCEWTSMLALVLGAVFWIQIAHVTGAAWLAPVRRLFEHVSSAMPALLVLSLPLGKWHVIIPCLVLFTIVAEVLRAWSIRNAPLDRTIALAGGTIPLVALAFTVLMFEVPMPVDFRSTIYALIVFAGGMVSSLSLAIVLAEITRVPESQSHLLLHEGSPSPAIPRGVLVSGSHFFAMGKMLFAFVIFWAYVSFSQLLLVWLANKRDEAHFYVERLQTNWKWLGLAMAIGHFAIPFACLLSWHFKRDPLRLAILGAFLIVMHRLAIAWLVLPTFRAGFSLADLGASLVFVGTVTLVVVFRWRAPLVAYDRVLERALAWEDA